MLTTNQENALNPDHPAVMPCKKARQMPVFIRPGF